ncbi:hypothetical protein U1Q18_004908 [Sarracenia purpurea var. burkii]
MTFKINPDFDHSSKRSKAAAEGESRWEATLLQTKAIAKEIGFGYKTAWLKNASEPTIVHLFRQVINEDREVAPRTPIIRRSPEVLPMGGNSNPDIVGFHSRGIYICP